METVLAYLYKFDQICIMRSDATLATMSSNLQFP